MPIVPEYIPLSREHRPHAVASWRDATPPPPAAAAAAATAVASAATAALAAADKAMSEATHGAQAASAPLAANDGGNGSPGDGGNRAKSARMRVRGGRAAAARRQGSGKEQQPMDVDDYFVHVTLPHEVSMRDVHFEVRAAVTPLKAFDLGADRQLFLPPRTAVNAATTTATAAATATTTTQTATRVSGDEANEDRGNSNSDDTNNGSGGGNSHGRSTRAAAGSPEDAAACTCSDRRACQCGTGACGAQATVMAAADDDAHHVALELSPFKTPALPPTLLSQQHPCYQLNNNGSESDGNNNNNSGNHERRTLAVRHSTPLRNDDNDDDGDDDAALPPPMMTLPPAQLERTNPRPASADHHYALLFAEHDEAQRAATLLRRRWPAASVDVLARNRSVLNCSLVLKGLPCLSKTEVILTELEQLPCRPSYVRLHRSDRGVYKNVVFVKYATPDAAEDSKLRLERLLLAPMRPLKVEFKKKTQWRADADTTSTAVAAASTTTTNADSVASLQHIIRDLRVSSEHEGVVFQRADLSKEELKLLKQLCQAYGLAVDVTETRVKVRRCFGVTGGGSGSGAGERPSPALRPQGYGGAGAATAASSAAAAAAAASVTTTPAWAPATPAPLRPMDFKGIRHWKEMHNTQANNTLGIARPLGPDDDVVPFSAGRGRPM